MPDTPATPPPPPEAANLTPRDIEAQVDLYDILIAETQQLGKHGATPWRRAASGRVEVQLGLLRSQLIP